jgi:hypothetical protein
LGKPDNRDYFRGPENVQRVQQWRAEHPGYWKQPPRKPRCTLQETCSAQVVVNEELAQNQAPQPSRPALQDLCEVKTPLLVGLIAQFTDTALQEDIVAYTRRLIARGQDIPKSSPKRNETKKQACRLERDTVFFGATLKILALTAQIRRK